MTRPSTLTNLRTGITHNVIDLTPLTRAPKHRTTAYKRTRRVPKSQADHWSILVLLCLLVAGIALTN